MKLNLICIVTDATTITIMVGPKDGPHHYRLRSAEARLLIDFARPKEQVWYRPVGQASVAAND